MVKHTEGEIRICIQVEVKAKVWIGPDQGEPANWEAARKPSYSQSASLTRTVDEDPKGKNALLVYGQLFDMSTHLGDFIAANALSKL